MCATSKSGRECDGYCAASRVRIAYREHNCDCYRVDRKDRPSTYLVCLYVCVCCVLANPLWPV
jgi:hypothetical protein